MNKTVPYLATSELRQRIAQLRRDLDANGDCYRTAKSQGDADQVTVLLRRKSELLREFFDAQSGLLLTFKRRLETADTKPSA